MLSLDSLLKECDEKIQGRLGKAPCEVREFYLLIEIPSRRSSFPATQICSSSERAFSSTTDTVPKYEIDLVASTLNKSQCVAIEKDRFDFENIFGMLKDELEKDDAFKKKEDGNDCLKHNSGSSVLHSVSDE